MSKWLLGLASGALAAVAGLRLKDSGNEDVISVLPMISFAFLLFSLYGVQRAMLLQDLDDRDCGRFTEVIDILLVGNSQYQDS
jgi:hypothetical protein